MLNSKRSLAWAPLFLAAGVSQAHHSRIGYDHERTVELTGTVTAINWQNPHVRIEVAAEGRGGENVVWTLETSSPSALMRNHVSQDILAVGESIEVVGYPARESQSPVAYIQSILKADGTLIDMPQQGNYRAVLPR
ncbi:MAG: DUF6152 family protein [Gammaproteobacteria bacterium]